MQELVAELGAATKEFEGRNDEKRKEFERIRDREVAKSETELAQQVRRVQDQCKIWAVAVAAHPAADRGGHRVLHAAACANAKASPARGCGRVVGMFRW